MLCGRTVDINTEHYSWKKTFFFFLFAVEDYKLGNPFVPAHAHYDIL